MATNPLEPKGVAEPEGEEFELELDDAEITENEDGSADINLESEAAEEAKIEEHFANLVEARVVQEDKLDAMAVMLLDLIERDQEAREERVGRYAETIDDSGLDGAGKKKADLSNVIHPLINEAAVDFAASVIKEIFPPSGPAKFQIIGKPHQTKVEKARRKANWLNYQATKQMVEFRPDVEQALSQTALTGAEYIKFWWDKRLDRPKCEPVYSDNVILPAAASSYLSADRKTHRQVLTQQEYDRRVKSGMYADVEVGIGADPEATQAEEATANMHGVEQDVENIDGQRTVYEIQIYIEIEDKERADPYLITIDESSRKIVAIYRNWAYDDDKREELLHMVEIGMIPWRGGYIGFKGLIGSLNTAASGALNALLDSAHANNLPAGLRAKNAGIQGQSISPQFGEITAIDLPVGVTDIRQAVMPLPFNPPSPVLFQLLGFLVQSGRGVVNTTMEKLADQNPNAPVGTTLALIEQGMKVFSGIHARMHGAMEQMLRILHRLNRCHLSTEDVVDETGEVTVRRADFAGPMDVAPVSDPAIFSETQRLAQIQAVMQRADLDPQGAIWNKREVASEFLDRIRLGELKDRLLAQVPQPQHLNAVNENAAAMLGRPIIAFPHQDHQAHIIAHCEFLRSPLLGLNPFFSQKAAPSILTHLTEHIAFLYAQRVYELTAGLPALAAQGIKPEDLMDPNDEEVTQGYDQLMAGASSQAIREVEQILQQYMGDIQKAAQFASQFQQPGANPAQMMQQQLQNEAQKTQAAMLSAQARQQDVQMKAQAQQQEAANDQARLQQETQADREENENRMQIAMINNDTRLQMNDSDNRTAKELAAAEILHGERVAVSTGTGINPSP